MDAEQTFGEIERRRSADWLMDMRLRSKVFHWEAKDLMHAPYERPRDLVRTPWRTEGPKSKVRYGYVFGSPAERASEALGLSPSAYGVRAFGHVAFVERPKADGTVAAKRPKADAARKLPPDYAQGLRADGTGVVSLTDHQLMKDLGIMPIGYLD